MEYTLLDLAYGGLLHDIGKFYQRTYLKSNLNQNELDTTPIHFKYKYNTHLHSGYTSRFLLKYLNMNNGPFEKLVSEHHKDNLDNFSKIIKKADCIASAIDRRDEENDFESSTSKKQYITTRMYSVFEEINFDEKKYRKDAIFPLRTFEKMSLPIVDYKCLDPENSANEYKQLFTQFIAELEQQLYLKNKINFVSFNYMYNLLNKYLVTIPAATYKINKPKVSLFDHLKLTAAIASCLYNVTDINNCNFYMLEIDVSGIQKFIYQIVEGTETKEKLAKALRGRSALVGLITNAISYSFLNEFGLTQTNILFNSGGGATILLPATSITEEKVAQVAKKVQEGLFELFQSDITFVYALIKINQDELEKFQSQKAVELKERLGRKKMQKFSNIIDYDFFYEKIGNNETCPMCGRTLKNNQCDVCQMVDITNEIYSKYSDFGIIYDFNNQYQNSYIKKIDLKFVVLSFIDRVELINDIKVNWYVDSINNFGFGYQKMVSNQVPYDKTGNILNFNEILELTPDQYGDKKLAILKMDVDNLGGIFAFGLKDDQNNSAQRSISKYVTMSRLMEYFFGQEIKSICKDVSLKINNDISSKVKNETMFYINYAGGDDLVIIGSAYSIIQLSLEIENRFAQFTNNRNITISGGIHIQHPKKPVRFGVQEAEKQLSLSKDRGKNAISLLDTTISYDLFKNILDDVNKICFWLNSNQISRTMLYNILSLIKDLSYDMYIKYIPRLQYILFRNIGDNDKLFMWFKNEINQVVDSKKLEDFVLKLKLVMLFTRDVKEK